MNDPQFIRDVAFDFVLLQFSLSNEKRKGNGGKKRRREKGKNRTDKKFPLKTIASPTVARDAIVYRNTMRV